MCCIVLIISFTMLYRWNSVKSKLALEVFSKVKILSKTPGFLEYIFENLNSIFVILKHSLLKSVRLYASKRRNYIFESCPYAFVWRTKLNDILCSLPRASYSHMDRRWVRVSAAGKSFRFVLFVRSRSGSLDRCV